jgi:hypothetical protein
MINDKWNLQNIPPKNHADVGEFAYNLFDIARQEKERLNKPQDFLANYALYRSRENKQQSGRKGYNGGNKQQTLVNLYFANIERTVSNITARNPTGEVVDLDGSNDGSENVLSMQLKKWWKETDQQPKTKTSARMMELYGLTSEKPYWDKLKDRPDIMVTDPFALFPCPGNWDDMSEDAPYVCYAYVDFISKIEADFGVKDIAPDDAYELMGAEREDYKPQGYGNQQSIGNYADAMTVNKKDQASGSKSMQRCLVIELWIRDGRKVKKKSIENKLDAQGIPELNQNGEELAIETKWEEPAYPDGIRKITFTKSKDPTIKSGVVVLDDSANPNINPALPVDLACNTYPWGRLPVYHANSYKDGVSVWGFAAAEQVGDLIVKINLIITKLVAYVINVMCPPLIVQKNCGITRDMIENSIQKAGRLILMPTTPNARIEFMQIPNLPATFFQVLDLVVKFFDRVYQIEDADRGVAPTGVIAASAIVALQERNQVLMQTKTCAIDTLAEQKSRWAIGLWQNFGTKTETVNVGGEMTPFLGVQYAGRKFNYVVEAGSTTPRTSLQLQEIAKWLFEVKAIGQRGLLETLNWPNWKEELERTAEGQLDQALQIIIAAGLPEEAAIQLKEALMASSTQTQENEQRKPAPKQSTVATVQGG